MTTFQDHIAIAFGRSAQRLKTVERLTIQPDAAELVAEAVAPRRPRQRRHDASPDQSAIFGLGSAISFACRALNSLARNQALFSEGLQSFHHAGPADAKHDRQERVSERLHIIFYPIARGPNKSKSSVQSDASNLLLVGFWASRAPRLPGENTNLSATDAYGHGASSLSVCDVRYVKSDHSIASSVRMSTKFRPAKRPQRGATIGITF